MSCVEAFEHEVGDGLYFFVLEAEAAVCALDGYGHAGGGVVEFDVFCRLGIGVLDLDFSYAVCHSCRCFGVVGGVGVEPTGVCVACCGLAFSDRGRTCAVLALRHESEHNQ